MEKCYNWDQNCHLIPNDKAKECAEKKGIKCPNLDSWKHYPDSPWGNIDICPHGNTRDHGSTEKVCIYCDC